MSMEFTLNDLQRQRVEDHLALVEQVLRRSIKTNETVDGMGYDDLYQEGCIALCRASVSYREEMGAFPAYAKVVIRNHLLDRCREIQSARKNLPLLSLDAFAEMGASEPVSPFHTEDLISDVSSDALLSHFRNRYCAMTVSMHQRCCSTTALRCVIVNPFFIFCIVSFLSFKCVVLRLRPRFP